MFAQYYNVYVGSNGSQWIGIGMSKATAVHASALLSSLRSPVRTVGRWKVTQKPHV